MHDVKGSVHTKTTVKKQNIKLHFKIKLHTFLWRCTVDTLESPH